MPNRACVDIKKLALTIYMYSFQSCCITGNSCLLFHLPCRSSFDAVSSAPSCQFSDTIVSPPSAMLTRSPQKVVAFHLKYLLLPLIFIPPPPPPPPPLSSSLTSQCSHHVCSQCLLLKIVLLLFSLRLVALSLLFLLLHHHLNHYHHPQL